jgi:hypothetical protein
VSSSLILHKLLRVEAVEAVIAAVEDGTFLQKRRKAGISSLPFSFTISTLMIFCHSSAFQEFDPAAAGVAG